jgi:glycosyltransferase involved in cell wall biosynthesis
MTSINNVLVIIPSFDPPDTFPSLCKKLYQQGFQYILVVNDGSPEYSTKIFFKIKELGVHLINLEKNEGKGHALKLGIQYAYKHFKSCNHVVFCDDDGQHTPDDVANVALFGLKNNYDFVIGTRNILDMPIKSFIGNAVTIILMRSLHGIDIPDTQSGLRFFSMETLSIILELVGKRFSFETHSLIRLKKNNIPITTFPIKTIYFDQNKKSRFQLLEDSMDVLKSFFK